VQQKADTRPPHQQIAAEIRAAILSGDAALGSQLETTQQLMARFGVTNQTIQRALKVLKAEGFVVGRAGSGVYVRARAQQIITPASYARPAAPGEPYPWVTEARRRGQRGGSRLLEVGEVKPPVQVAAALGLAENGVAVLRHQVMLLDDEPAELAWSYYPVEIARGTPLAESRRIRGGAPAYLAERGLRPEETVDHVSVRLPTTGEFVGLELPDDVPVLRTFRVVLAAGRRPIEVSVLVKAGYAYELEYRITSD